MRLMLDVHERGEGQGMCFREMHAGGCSRSFLLAEVEVIVIKDQEQGTGEQISEGQSDERAVLAFRSPLLPLGQGALSSPFGHGVLSSAWGVVCI